MYIIIDLYININSENKKNKDKCIFINIKKMQRKKNETEAKDLTRKINYSY